MSKKTMIVNWASADLPYLQPHSTIFYLPLSLLGLYPINEVHDDVMKWKHFLRYWPFVRGIHRWPVNSPHLTKASDAEL